MPFASDERRVLPANKKSQSLNIGSVVFSAPLSITGEDISLDGLKLFIRRGQNTERGQGSHRSWAEVFPT